MVEFYLKLKLILRIITYLAYICREIDNFVIKSDIFRRFFVCKNILKKLSCYHDNNFGYFMFGKYNGFVSKARVSACMYFLVLNIDFIPRADGEGTNSLRLFTPGETKALAESKVHQISRERVTNRWWSSSLISNTWRTVMNSGH